MKMTQWVFQILFLFILLSNPALAKIEFRTVQTTGTGSTIKIAINEALSEAIARINGLSLETRSKLDSVEVSKADNNNEEYFYSETYQKSIKEATKGVVDGYSIIKQERNNNGLWELELSVKVVKYKHSKRSNRKRIAIMPFRISIRDFQVEGRSINKINTNRILGQGLVSNLVQSRKFTVLDREYIREILGEKKLIVGGDTPITEMARIGQELVADYILVGTLEDINFKTSKIKMQISGRELTSRKGKVELSYRIIDVDTKQIVFSEFARFRITESDIRKIDSSIGIKNIESMLCMIASGKIGKKILNAIYPVLVVSVSGENIVLGQGGSGIKRGDRYDVFEYGKKINDPYTKEFIGREEIYTATIEITNVNPKQSYAKILKSEKDIAQNFKPKKFVCRIPQNFEDMTVVKKKKREEAKKKKEKKRDEDW
ncbi:MAG: CsgG/HfaB family protein [Desulfobacteraceae bacterium]|nr:CsgG/HfaB family protein [Desulfobacteraceae bacterium]